MEILGQFFELLLHVDDYLFQLVNEYGTLTYVILFAIVFCETGLVVTPFLPGDSLLFAAGTIAGAGYLDYPIPMLVLLAAAIIGDSVNYHIGRFLGPAIFQKETRYLNRQHLMRANDFYEKHGGKAIILARFIPIIRTFAPFVAGIAAMNTAKFLFFNITGATIWVVSLVSAGYFFGNTPFVQKNFSLLIYAIIVISVLPIVFDLGRVWLKKRALHKAA